MKKFLLLFGFLASASLAFADGPIIRKATAAEVTARTGEGYVPASLLPAGSGNGDMILGAVQTVIGAKTFGSAGAVGKLKIAGSTSGSTILDAQAVAGTGTVLLPTTGTLATLAGSEALTNKSVNGVTVGTTTGSFTIGDGTRTLTVTANATIGGTMAISGGGTGQTTAAAAFDALTIHGADISSATTTNLDTATGSYVHITGTTTITGITLSDGRVRYVIFDGVLTLTAGSNLILPNCFPSIGQS